MAPVCSCLRIRLMPSEPLDHNLIVWSPSQEVKPIIMLSSTRCTRCGALGRVCWHCHNLIVWLQPLQAAHNSARS